MTIHDNPPCYKESNRNVLYKGLNEPETKYVSPNNNHDNTESLK